MRELGLAVVGTARERICWPQKDTNKISDRIFNNIKWIYDERNFQIQILIGDNVVTIIITLHTPEETTRRIQRKPMVNQANKNHLELVRGKKDEK